MSTVYFLQTLPSTAASASQWVVKQSPGLAISSVLLHKADASNHVNTTQREEDFTKTITVHRGRSCLFKGRITQLLLQTDEEGETAGDYRLSKWIFKVVIYVDFAP